MNSAQYAQGQEMIQRDNGSNSWVLSVLNPRIPSIIPDPSDFTASVAKTIYLQKEYAMAGNGSIILWAPSKRIPKLVLLLGQDAVTGFYNPVAVLPYSEDLSENYTQARLVSGCLAVKSSTVTGNAFTVSGDVTAISYQRAPPFVNVPANENGVTFETLLAYGRNTACKLTAVTVADGAIVLDHPEGKNNFVWTDLSLTSTNYFPSDAMWGGSRSEAGPRVIRSAAMGNTPRNGWVGSSTTVAIAPAITTLFDSLNCTYTDGSNYVPPNCCGKIRVEANLSMLQNSVGNAYPNIFLGITVQYGDATTYATRTVELTMQQAKETSSENGGIINMWLDSGVVDMTNAGGLAPFCWITRVRIWANLDAVSSATMITASVPTNGTVTFVGMECFTLAEDWYLGPGTIFAVEGVSVNQILQITGTSNYEAVPNANLSKQLPTEVNYIKSDEDMLMANYFFSHMRKIGVPMVFALSDYARCVSDLSRLSDRRVLRGMAAGFREGLWKFWTNYLAPVLKRVVAPVAGAIGGVIAGPGGAAVGANIGNFASGLIPDYQTGQSTGYESGLAAGGVRSVEEVYKAQDQLQRYHRGYCGGLPFLEEGEERQHAIIMELLAGGPQVVSDLVKLLCMFPGKTVSDIKRWNETMDRIEQLRLERGGFEIHTEPGPSGRRLYMLSHKAARDIAKGQVPVVVLGRRTIQEQREHDDAVDWAVNQLTWAEPRRFIECKAQTKKRYEEACVSVQRKKKELQDLWSSGEVIDLHKKIEEQNWTTDELGVLNNERMRGETEAEELMISIASMHEEKAKQTLERKVEQERRAQEMHTVHLQRATFEDVDRSATSLSTVPETPRGPLPSQTSDSGKRQFEVDRVTAHYVENTDGGTVVSIVKLAAKEASSQ